MEHKNIRWWHKVKLNNGEYTDGHCDMENLRKKYLFDELDFRDKIVIDIGSWDGYFSFESEKRGASKVISLDNADFRWGGYDGYNFLHDHFNSKCELVIGSVYNLINNFDCKSFDIVLCYGVLYHLSDPLLALKNIFYVCGNKVGFEGLFFESDNPTLELLPPGIYGNDKGNTYNISVKYLSDVAKLCGFNIIKKQFNGDRGSVICERISDSVDFYNDYVFPV